MNILIIDDEKLTREGIISAIDWKKLGINEIYEADDGINGITQAKLHKPKIILSDIRMPRMNGIEMSKEIHKILPSSSIIFMSGYSDKGYLKAAITLKVVSYVEKPINTLEIESAIKAALDVQLMHAKNQININYHNRYAQHKLSLEINSSPLKKSIEEYIKQFQDMGLSIKSTTEFTTIIITLKVLFSNISEHNLAELYLIIDKITKKYRMNNILTIKNDEYIILNLFTNDKTNEYNLKNICYSLSDYLSTTYKNYITIGKTVRGIKKVYESYNLAALLLQSSFFYDYNSIITSETTQPYTIDKKLFIAYRENLTQHNKEEVLELTTNLFQSLTNNQHILPNYAKDIYYKLFTILYETALSFQLNPFHDEDSITILDYVSKDNSLADIHQILLDRINQFFSSLQVQMKENTTIFMIKEFISKNYSNESLSVKDISENVFLSSSYVCTLFKNETGNTLNQYLTDYRIEKAKNMLKDSRYKITDISSKIGYSDGNYFGKTFKKLVGLSPSEYREQFGK